MYVKKLLLSFLLLSCIAFSLNFRVQAQTTLVSIDNVSLALLDNLIFEAVETHNYTVWINATPGYVSGVFANATLLAESGTLSYIASASQFLTVKAYVDDVQSNILDVEAANYTIDGSGTATISMALGEALTLSWGTFVGPDEPLEPTLLLPIIFIFGMVGLGCLFVGPVYGLNKMLHKEYRDGLVWGVIITALGFALFISWLFGGVF